MLFVSSVSIYIASLLIKHVRKFQSRNRDAFRFKWSIANYLGNTDAMLRIVSISESRCFSFQGILAKHWKGCDQICNVSISESRCFSFQVNWLILPLQLYCPLASMFQSRNRDAFRFKYIIYIIYLYGTRVVSISESRCFSFQEHEFWNT